MVGDLLTSFHHSEASIVGTNLLPTEEEGEGEIPDILSIEMIPNDDDEFAGIFDNEVPPHFNSRVKELSWNMTLRLP